MLIDVYSQCCLTFHIVISTSDPLSTKVSASSWNVSMIISRIFIADLKWLESLLYHHYPREIPSNSSTWLYWIPLSHIDCTRVSWSYTMLYHVSSMLSCVWVCLKARCTNLPRINPRESQIAKSKRLSLHLADFSNRLCTRDLLARQGILETRGGTPLVAALGSTISWRSTLESLAGTAAPGTNRKLHDFIQYIQFRHHRNMHKLSKTHRHSMTQQCSWTSLGFVKRNIEELKKWSSVVS